MSSISPTSRPGYVYDSATDTWIPIGIGPHTHAATDISGVVDDSLIDARGDLIVGTAADTPGRLAVGGNDLFLTADSTQATGLKWSGAWQTWTPTWSALTVGNGTTNARYQQIGKTIVYSLTFTFGTTSSMGNGTYFTLPINPVSGTVNAPTMLMRDTGVAWFYGIAIAEGNTVYINAINTGGTYAQPAHSSTIPFNWGAGDYFTVNGIYEVA